jgi:hypothetical protein
MSFFCRVKSERTKQFTDELIRDTHTHLAANFRSIDFIDQQPGQKEKKEGHVNIREMEHSANQFSDPPIGFYERN